MPNHQVHCMDSNNRYGYDFSEIHKWMDEPSKVAGSKHRVMRHDPFVTPQEAEKIFWDKVPVDQRQNIKHVVLDHIKLDIERTSSKVQNYHLDTISKKMNADVNQLSQWLREQINKKSTIAGNDSTQIPSEYIDKGIKIVLNWHSFTKDLELDIDYKERLKKIQKLMLEHLLNQIHFMVITTLEASLQNALINLNMDFSRKQKKAIKKFFKKWGRFDKTTNNESNINYINFKNEITKLDETGVLPEFTILHKKAEKLLGYEKLKEKIQMCYKKITEEKEGEFKISVDLKPVKYCPECGFKNKQDAKFCVECGKKF